MKFPRTARILRSHFDVAPFAAMFFLLVILVMLGALLPTPGISLLPPAADDLPGTDQPTVAMAVDAAGNLYYDNQIVTERMLINRFMVATNTVRAPLTLILHADRTVPYDTLVRLSLLATLPRVEDAPAKP